MSMNGIDISSWQQTLGIQGLDPACRFVICKATQGGAYTAPTMRAQADATLASGRLLGLYHYADGSGAEAEAVNFATATAPWQGRAVLALDWEAGDNRKWGDTAYLRDLIRHTKRLTGLTPLVYCSSSTLPAVKPVADAEGCPLWVAQYANSSQTGWQEHPWNEDAYECLIRQYSSRGRVAGYASDLDLDLAYTDADTWRRLAQGDTTQTSTQTLQDDEEDTMQCIIQINDERALRYFDGTRTHLLTHPDQVEALRQVYRACHGKDMPCIKLGTDTAPWGTRLLQAIGEAK